MNPGGAAVESLWQRCSPNYIKQLPVLSFPFEHPPDIYAPASTVLRMADGRQHYIFKWCYLRHQLDSRRGIRFIDISSLSQARVMAMPMVLERLSKWLRFKNSRPATVTRSLATISEFLSWADHPQHAGCYEKVFSDSDLALEALKAYHVYLRSRVQSHQLRQVTAGGMDNACIACMSEIHGINFSNEIQPLQSTNRGETKVPDAQSVGEFCSTLQAIFDSSSDIILEDRPVPPGMQLRISATDDSKIVKLRVSYGPMRLMELACVAYAGLVFADSGANLAVLKEYEEPDDLDEQLAKPERINLTQKAVKFRAGGKAVDVHLSATSITRLETYLRVRQKLVTSLGCDDIAPMFIQCTYDKNNQMGEPCTICALDQRFLNNIRRKVTRIGASLPRVTLRQLRAYKQQDLVRRTSVQTASEIMGHSVETAIQAYCKAQEATHRQEMGNFLDSLQKTVLTPSQNIPKQPHQKDIPNGKCADYGMPLPTNSAPVVEPDCKKFEG